MDKETIRQRRLRKQRQMRQRKMIRLGVIGVGGLLVLIFLIKGVILPLVGGAGKGNAEIESEEDGIVSATAADPDDAIRIPIKGSGDVQKATSLVPGWHEDSSGRWYQNSDGTYFASGFLAIDGNTYSFDDNGYIQTGWVEKGARELYFNDDGTYNPDKKRPMLCLTYDDGPGQYTDELLDCLEENGAHATFFMLGECIPGYPDAPKRMLELGCELGTHSYDHPQLTTLSLEDAVNQFIRADEELIKACGQKSTVARAPYGDGNLDIYQGVEKPFIFWSLDSLDWKYLDVELDYDAIMNGDLTDGSIILMHDIHEPSVKTSLRIIPELIEKGYKLVTISEMAAAKNVDLQYNIYTDFWQSSLNNGLVAGYKGVDTKLVSTSSSSESETSSEESSSEESNDESYDESYDDSYDDSYDEEYYGDDEEY